LKRKKLHIQKKWKQQLFSMSTSLAKEAIEGLLVYYKRSGEGCKGHRCVPQHPTGRRQTAWIWREYLPSDPKEENVIEENQMN
jgi:hypothetical protein